MAAVSSFTALPLETQARFLIGPCDVEDIVTQKIQDAIVLSMHELCVHYRDKWNQTAPTPSMTTLEKFQKVSLLQKGPWLAADLYRRCEELNQTKLIQKYKNNNRFVTGFMDSKSFELTGDKNLPDDERLHFYFRAKMGQNAYKLAMEPFSNFSIIDNAVAIRLVQYRAIALCLGEKRFNFVFSDAGYGRLNFSPTIHPKHQPLLPLLGTRVLDPPPIYPGDDTFKPGDVCLFLGHSDYLKKHPFDSGAYLFAVYCGDEVKHLFSHFKLEAVASESEVTSYLAIQYNSEPNQWDKKFECGSGKISRRRKVLYECSEADSIDIRNVCMGTDIPGCQTDRIIRIRARVLQALAQTSKEKLAFGLKQRARARGPHVTFAH